MPPFRFRQLTEDEVNALKSTPGLSTVEGTLGAGGLSYTFKDEDDSVTFSVNKDATFDPEDDNYLFDYEDDLRAALQVVDSAAAGGRRRRRRGARKTHRKIKRTTKQTRRR
jgi:hypothetical protein